MKVVAIGPKNTAGETENVNPDLPAATFNDFWRAYPKKRARKDAEKAWARIAAERHPEILQALARHCQADDWRRDGGRFIPYPATYLNGERWTDEFEAAPSLGQCVWNANGNREDGKPRCDATATTEKRGLPYCKAHSERA